MQINARFDHYNINVFNLKASLEFYEAALGLKEVRRKEAEDGSFIIVYLGDGGRSSFLLELTWLRDWENNYNLGDNEQHLCLRTSEDYEKVREYHRQNGWICYENHSMGLYFISDPDGYWVEILPEKFS